jgi:hypothetical protein
VDDVAAADDQHVLVAQPGERAAERVVIRPGFVMSIDSWNTGTSACGYMCRSTLHVP